MTQVELAQAMKELRELDQQAKAIEERKEFLQDSIKAEMTSRGVDELSAGQFRATWKECTSHRFDSKAFKEADPVTYEKYNREYKVRRFLLK